MRPSAAALVGLCLAASAALAQAPPPPPGPVPQPPEGEAPQLDRTRALAAKLAGLVDFVNADCPELRGDTERLQAALRRLGVEPEALVTGALRPAAAAYLESYRKDVPANCRRALETFGPESRLVPNLVARR